MSVVYFSANPDISTYANAAALAAVATTSVANGTIAKVTGLGNFKLNKTSTATADNTSYIAAANGGNWEVFTNIMLSETDSTIKLDAAQIPWTSVPSGTAAAPAIAFNSDSDTGIYSVGANQLGIAVGGALKATVAASAVTLASGVGLTMTSARMQLAKGANVASAGDVTLGSDGNFFTITGTTTINTIVATGWQSGSKINLQFNASVTVKHNTAGAGASLLLAGAADFSATANDTLELIYNGTNWCEVARAVI